MSERKNLKWICRRCVAKQKGLEIEKDTELEKKCSFCGTETWCFLVASSRLVGEVVESKPLSEQPLEEESTEEIEAIEEVAEEALEEILEVIERQEESPEETAPAEGQEPTEEEVAAPSPEDVAEAAKNANIARLEAELEALNK